MAGIITTNIDKDDPLKSVAGYEAERVTTGAEDMVENRVAGIIAKNSPLMKQAQTAAAKSMNARGVLNSSMAIGAAQDATIRTALPIAQQDAQTSFQGKLANQQAGNAALSQTAQAQTEGALQQHQGIISKELQQMQGGQQLEQIEKQGEIQKLLQELQGQQSMEQLLAKGDLDQRLQGIIGQQRLAEIAASGDVQKLIQELQGQQQLQQIAAQGDQQRTTQQMIQEHQVQLAQLQHQLQLGQIDAQTLAQMKINQQQIEAQVQRDIELHKQALEAARVQGDIQAERDAQLQIYNLESMAEQTRNQIKLADVNLAHQTTLEQLSQENRVALQQLQNQHQQTLQNSGAATNLYMTTMQAISQIGASPELTAAQRQAGINQQIDMLRAGLDFMGMTADQTFTIYGAGAANTTNAPAAGGGTTGGTTGTVPNATIGLSPGQSGVPERAAQNVPTEAGRYPGEIKEVKVRTGSIRSSIYKYAWDGNGWVYVK